MRSRRHCGVGMVSDVINVKALVNMYDKQVFKEPLDSVRQSKPMVTYTFNTILYISKYMITSSIAFCYLNK